MARRQELFLRPPLGEPPATVRPAAPSRSAAQESRRQVDGPSRRQIGRVAPRPSILRRRCWTKSSGRATEPVRPATLGRPAVEGFLRPVRTRLAPRPAAHSAVARARPRTGLRQAPRRTAPCRILPGRCVGGDEVRRDRARAARTGQDQHTVGLAAGQDGRDAGLGRDLAGRARPAALRTRLVDRLAVHRALRAWHPQLDAPRNAQRAEEPGSPRGRSVQGPRCPAGCPLQGTSKVHLSR